MPNDRMHYAVGWADGESGSLYGWRHKYCDCNLAELCGKPVPRCDHTMPPTRFTALMAYLDDGREVSLEQAA